MGGGVVPGTITGINLFVSTRTSVKARPTNDVAAGEESREIPPKVSGMLGGQMGSKSFTN